VNLSKILHLVGYVFYLGASLVARPIPLPAVYWMGRVVGHLGFFLMPTRRRLAVSNMTLALGIPETEARELALQHFKNLGANVLSMLKVPTMSDAAIWRHVTFEIGPHVPKEPGGKGWVAVFGHSSNWELLGRLTKLFPQYRFGALYRKLSNAAVNRHFNKTRVRMGVQLFDRQEEFWDAVAFLESGGVLGVLSDQYAGVSGTWMPFFGRLTSTSTLAAALAHRVDVPIVPLKSQPSGGRDGMSVSVSRSQEGVPSKSRQQASMSNWKNRSGNLSRTGCGATIAGRPLLWGFFSRPTGNRRISRKAFTFPSWFRIGSLSDL